ncbi:MAG: hypothetical protein QOE90_3341 [Thermoplasmata archaeon]|jgi:hypothetical protein|nr:hypothetical protein [Thermoplasmata archaeon]
MRAAERIILAKAESDLDAGLSHLRERLAREAHGPLAFLARGLEAAVMGGLAALELRPRLRDDVVFLMDLAKRVHAGEDPAPLAREHLPRVLRVRELNLVVKVKDPRFAPVLARCEAEMALRLPDLARMVMVEEPKDYDELLLAAFPTREIPDHIVAENTQLMDWIFGYAEQHPDLLRLPRSVVPKLATIGRDVTAWQTARVVRGLDEAYAKPPPDSPTPS